VILSAIEGVQSQTENMIRLLKKYQKPFIIFINKIDRVGADVEAVCSELQNELDLELFVFHNLDNEAEDNVSVDMVWTEDKKPIVLIEKLIEYDENLFEDYFEDKQIEWRDLDDLLLRLVHQQKVIPVLFGSAKKAIGINELLDTVVKYLPAPISKSDKLLGIVFKTNHQKKEGKMSAVRLFGGQINARDILLNASKNEENKITLIKDVNIQQQSVIQSFTSGEIAWVQGLKSAEPGDYIGFLPEKRVKQEKSEALLTVKIIPQKESDIKALIEVMTILNNEDPNLNFEYLKDTQEFNVSIRGQVQQEILQSVLLARFNIVVDFSKPTVIYKETPTKSCEGFVRYWLPKPCWAIMKFKIEPGERGSGIVYASEVGVNDIKQKYQNDVEKALPFALKQGVLGWQVDDIKITLIEGEDHEVHTKSNDFTIATPMGIMDGLAKSDSSLLEPILNFKIIAPEEYLGTLVGELTKMRAEIKSHTIEKGNCKLQGLYPLADSIDFPIKLSSITSGKGKIISSFHSYQICDISKGKTREYKGISPLDTAKYILKARKALT